MSTGMYGLDPQDCHDLAKLLKNSAHQLERTGAQLNQTVTRTGWQGPDSQRFRSQWPGNRTRLNQTAKDLEDIATVVLREIAEQERASSANDGGGSLWDGLLDAGKGLWDDFTDGVGNAIDTVGDGLGWLGAHAEGNFTQATGTFLTNLNHLGNMGLDIFSGNPPSVSGLFAQIVLTGGSGANSFLVHSTGGLLNAHLFDDGSPSVGDPRAIPQSSKNPLQMPTSVASIFGSVEDAYAMSDVPGTEDGDIRIVSVKQDDGTYAYIVNIPGTEQWGPTGSGQARDLTSNLMLVAGQSTTAQQDIVLAMERAGIPPGAPVMLAGHSQGGMLAAQLGSDQEFLSQYNVTNIMTVGSPIDTSTIDPRINVLAAQHEGDLVPKLDLGGVDTHLSMPGTPSNTTVVTMDDPPRDTLGNILHYTPSPLGNSVQSIRDVINNHATENYVSDLKNTSKYPELAVYEQDPSMTAFLSDDPERVTGMDIPVGRK